MKQQNIIHPKFRPLEPDLRRILASFDSEGTVLHSGRNTIKLFNLPPYALNIKRYKRPNLLNRIVYTFLRKPKAERAYIHSEQIIRLGFRSPQPVAWFVMKRWGLISDSFYISTQENYARNMYEFGKGGIVGREDIIRAFARYTAALHDAGIFHRDYSPGNILFDWHDDSASFCLVDVNRMSFGNVSVARGCRAFAALWGDDDMFGLIAREYADARQADAGKCRKMIFRSRRLFWMRYSAKHGMPYLSITF